MASWPEWSLRLGTTAPVRRVSLRGSPLGRHAVLTAKANAMTDWLTVAESAAYAKRSTRTIRQRIHDGDLPAYVPRGSRVLLIDRADLDEMIRHGDRESLAAQIRRVIAEHGEEWPEPTDDQIREIARLLPRPAVTADHDAA